jgi:cadmium resistance protein CadD (predicted permease)
MWSRGADISKKICLVQHASWNVITMAITCYECCMIGMIVLYILMFWRTKRNSHHMKMASGKIVGYNTRILGPHKHVYGNQLLFPIKFMVYYFLES